MAQQNPLPAPSIEQFDIGYCGPACAEMILRGMGRIPDTAGSQQEHLFNQIKGVTRANVTAALGTSGKGFQTVAPGTTLRLCQSANQICEGCPGQSDLTTCWCTFPVALSIILDGYRTETSPIRSAVITQRAGAQNSPEQDASKQLITGLAVASIQSGFPAAVLMYRGRHWVVVFGSTPADFSSLPPVSLFVHDPDLPNLQAEFQYEEWLSTFLDEPPACGMYSGHWVLVGAGKLPEQLEPSPPDVSALGAPMPIPEVLTQATLEAARLSAKPEWGAALLDAQPVGLPIQVGHLGHQPNYYIVNFQTGGKQTARLMFRLDGTFQAVEGIKNIGESLPNFIEPSQVGAAADGQQITLGTGELFTIVSGELDGEAPLVWRMCDNSHSPFLPFYQLRFLHSDVVLYLRIDGKIFSDLDRTNGGA
jgi:hypothetical protein